MEEIKESKEGWSRRNR